MIGNIVNFIRSKSREEWRATVMESWTDLRIWIQENAELAFVLGLAAGILLVLIFKIFLFLFVIAILGAFIVWNVALPEADIAAYRAAKGAEVVAAGESATVDSPDRTSE